MKTTVEIPDDLFRQAKARAALEGSSLRELMTEGLRRVLQTPRSPTRLRRAPFPLIRAEAGASLLTDDETAAALAELDEEEAHRHANTLRR